jgi:arsenate reductase/ArsR family transcriptional regulator
MRELEVALKAAGDPTRTRILKLLAGGELCVCQIQAVLGIAPSTVSKHLSILKFAGLVEDRREGKWIHYRISTAADNPHARGVLTLLAGALDREPRVLEDRRRLKQVLKMPAAELCELQPPRGAEPRSAVRGRKSRVGA